MFSKADEQLIKQALKGDKKAWFSLIKRYESAVYNYAVRMTGSRDDGLDLMQEIFISVFRNLDSYRGEGAFKAWMFRIAHYRCVEFYRKKKDLSSLDDVPERVDTNSCPDDALLSSESDSRIVMAMQNLSVNQKAVVELKFFGQFTFDEIAQQLSISSNTAKSRLYSALENMKNILEVEHAQ